MRVTQWTKNFFVYAALLFHGGLFHGRDFYVVSLAFLSFCLASSSVYFVNDIFDVHSDRLNPKKCHRPIASRAIPIPVGWACAAVLLTAGLAISSRLDRGCLLLLLSYVVINLLYAIWLKHIVIIDVMIIAYGFVVRAIVGAWAGNISMTNWFFLCVMFLSLFLALGKRRQELLAVQERRLQEGRHVLQHYTLSFIDQMMTIVTTAILMCYALFAMDPKTRDVQAMALTIPLVLYGIFYYLYLIHVKRGGDAPDEALYKEKPLLAVVLLYILWIAAVRSW